MRELINAFLNKGIYNSIDAELIPREAASRALGCITKKDGWELARGKIRVGNNITGEGEILAEHIGYRADGTPVHFRKITTKLQYLNTANNTWTDIVTGLTDDAEYVFTDVVTLAGTFVIAWGIDGIYKIHTANPQSYRNMYDEAVNFLGKAIYDKGRHILWDREDDPTALYLGFVDEANYPVVTNENIGTGNNVLTTFTDTLVEATGKRTVFGIEVTDGTETFRDDKNGNLIGSAGGFGTINYTTGAISVTFDDPVNNAQAITCTYQYEDSNDGGVTDFRYTEPNRVAGEGDVFRQDRGGDRILNVIPFQGEYHSIKKYGTYKLRLSDDDLSATNDFFMSGIGVPNWRAVTPTSKGIVMLNTARPEEPELIILQANPVGDNLIHKNLVPQYDFSAYDWDRAVMETYGPYVLLAGKTRNSDANDRILLIDMQLNSVDVVPYHANTFAKDGATLYAGDSLSDNVYEMFTGWTNDGFEVEGYWEGNAELYGTENLKKVKDLILKGLIMPDQSFDVYFEGDDNGFELVGSVSGRGEYVDTGNPETVGSSMVGEGEVGGGSLETVYRFHVPLKIRVSKFRKRKWRFVPTGIGYLKLNMIHDRDIRLFGNKLPKKYRRHDEDDDDAQ